MLFDEMRVNLIFNKKLLKAIDFLFEIRTLRIHFLESNLIRFKCRFNYPSQRSLRCLVDRKNFGQ